MTDKPQEPRDLIQICTDIYYECGTIKRLDELTDEALDWHNKQIKDPFDYVQPCEPDCSPERHAYHQGQWDMAHRMVGKEAEL